MKFTKYDYDLLLVNPPSFIDNMGVSSFKEIPFKSGQFYLPENIEFANINTGILSIATYLSKLGFCVKIIDLSYFQSYTKLEEELEKLNPKIIGISNTSIFNYLEFLKCIDISRKYSPNSLIIGGGQHVSQLKKVVFNENSNLDILCKYEGEYVLERLLQLKSLKDLEQIPGIVYKIDNKIFENKGMPKVIELDDISPIKYELYPNYKSFMPYVEESRGCPFNCNYCSNAYTYNGKIRIKSAFKIIDEIESVIKLWGNDTEVAFLASNFGLSIQNTLLLAEKLKQYNIKWGTELRCDLAWGKYLDKLVESGLIHLNVGFESGSPEILKLMNKTDNPTLYIQKMEQLLEKVTKIPNLSIDVHFIFYVGESPQTLKESMKFFCNHSDKINSIGCNPVFIGLESEIMKNFNKYKNEFGSEIIDIEYFNKRHLRMCNPSKYFSFLEALSFCNTMEKIFTSEEGWLKNNIYHYKNKQDLKSLLMK